MSNKFDHVPPEEIEALYAKHGHPEPYLNTVGSVAVRFTKSAAELDAMSEEELEEQWSLIQAIFRREAWTLGLERPAEQPVRSVQLTGLDERSMRAGNNVQ